MFRVEIVYVGSPAMPASSRSSVTTPPLRASHPPRPSRHPPLIPLVFLLRAVLRFPCAQVNALLARCITFQIIRCVVARDIQLWLR
jgi:hypothetical protein